MQSLTPREAQVERFVKALDQVPSVDLARNFPGFIPDNELPPGFDPAIPPREQIANAAVANFIAAVTAVQPWKGLGDFTDAELGALRRRAVAGALR